MVAWAETIVASAKENAHVVTGTLRRSIHAAPAEYTGENDFDFARHDIDLFDMQGDATMELPTWESESIATVLVGSWIPYAIYEEVRPGHEYLQPAYEASLDAVADIFRQAFEEEGAVIS
jgi:hypothetical protein